VTVVSETGPEMDCYWKCHCAFVLGTMASIILVFPAIITLYTLGPCLLVLAISGVIGFRSLLACLSLTDLHNNLVYTSCDLN